jgi:hypothetical protein
MTPADFEESEYRGPLYNQLERGNHLVWEPGQVFEKHIGIDRAAYVTDPYFWGLHGLIAPMNGVILLDYDWHYIWKNRLKNKILPDFKLNLFLQAKRPHAGTRPRGRAIAPSRHNAEHLGAEPVGRGGQHSLGLDAALA